MQYRVWHIPQVPKPIFYVEAPSLEAATLVREALVQYDLFQFHNRIKPDYSNASGIECREGPEHEWEGVDEDVE